jgi:hypothetical protein
MMRRKSLSGILAVAAAALLGIYATEVAAQPASQLWTVVVHFEYANGMSYDYPMATGVPTAEVPPILQECGRSHRNGTVVRYYCHPIPE